MNGDDLEPSFDDPSHDPIRALLRDARASEPMPAEVAARLDATLAELRGPGLRGQGAPAETVADVVALPRRAPRPRLLVAAAAVIILGAGGGGLALSLANQDSGRPATADTAVSGTAAIPRAPLVATPKPKSLDSLDQAMSPHQPGSLALSPAATSSTAFTTAGFEREAAAFAATTGTFSPEGLSGTAAGSGTGSGTATGGGASPTTAPVPGATAPQAGTKAAAACVTPTVTGAEVVAITLDGQPATLALHPVSAGKQLVEAWSCDGTHVLAHTTLTR